MATSPRRSVIAAFLTLTLVGGVVAVPPAAGASTPTTVTIAGSFQSELGCPGDWQPSCAATQLVFDEGDGLWHSTFAVPAGAWEYKVALDGSWTENYGAGGTRDGANIALSVATDTNILFLYDHGMHYVTDDVNSVIATAAGSFQSEMGCESDWDPACLRTWLRDPDGDGVGRFGTDVLPPGTYETKVAIDRSWTENYGAGGVAGGANIAFEVTAAGSTVTFAYDHTSHVLDIDVTTTVVADDAALVGEPVRHPVEDEVIYFAMLDRFDDGDPTNNCGSYTGACVAGDSEDNVLQHGYLPSDKGFRHGGDIEGLRRRLPYLQDLGVTAVWVSPVFGNRTVQPDSTNLYGHAAGYHGYWVLDFLHVDPHLGTDDDFRRLVDEVHDRGMKIFLDIVVNHTADVIQPDGHAGYRDKTDFPYRDVDGNAFDDDDHAYPGPLADEFPAVDETSFPYRPFVPADLEGAKNPAWLNDPLLYHNRGDSTFVGESSRYGDFIGLDDLWTERREVVEGMIEIYAHWIEEFGVDGFRIDTAKNVNLEFLQAFGPAMLEAAEARGIEDFFAFGEVADAPWGAAFSSAFTGTGRMQATLDFHFQWAARTFASESGETDVLRRLFASDDGYIDLDTSAHLKPTFLGNHDMGRIGAMLQHADQPGASDTELVARSKLAHALLFLTRGVPVVYYGDEQGFTGHGVDKDARQDMFANHVDDYADDDLLGTDATPSDDNFDQDHPLYRAIADLARLRGAHPALRTGAQIHRLSSNGPGVYAFSRVHRDERVEYVVALNNSERIAVADVPTYAPSGASFVPVTIDERRAPAAPVRTNRDGSLRVRVPALGFVVYRATAPLASMPGEPTVEVTRPAPGSSHALAVNDWDGHEIPARIEIEAEIDSGGYAEVTFAVRAGDGDFVALGTDDSPPYRAYFDATGHEGEPLTFRAIVRDLDGRLAGDEVGGVQATYSP